jgi:hypothetical protein
VVTKSCITCKYFKKDPKEEPCISCDVDAGQPKPNWEPDGLD